MTWSRWCRDRRRPQRAELRQPQERIKAAPLPFRLEALQALAVPVEPAEPAAQSVAVAEAVAAVVAAEPGATAEPGAAAEPGAPSNRPPAPAASKDRAVSSSRRTSTGCASGRAASPGDRRRRLRP